MPLVLLAFPFFKTAPTVDAFLSRMPCCTAYAHTALDLEVPGDGTTIFYVASKYMLSAHENRIME